MPNLLRKLVIREISVVDKGASGDAANRPRVVLYKRDGAATGQPFGFSLQVSKVDAEQGLVTGWASVISDATGKPIVDAQGDVILVADLEKAAHEALLSGVQDKAGDMHAKRAGDLVESIVVSHEKREALGFGKGPEGWVVTLKITDPEVRKQVKAGEKFELSIAGDGERVPAPDTYRKEHRPMSWLTKLLSRDFTKMDPGEAEAALTAALEGVAPDLKDKIMGAVAQMCASMKPAAPAEAGKMDEQSKAEMAKIAKRAEDAESKASALEKRAAEAEKTATDVAKKLDEVTKSLEVARIEKRKSEIAKVAGEFAHVPGDIAKRTERLFGIREKLGEEAYSEAVEEYRQSEALAKKALRERGTTGAADEGSAEAKINELAKGLVSKASGKDHLSFEQAFAKICSENPELYRQMRDEQRAN